jgi:hypothetical protein
LQQTRAQAEVDEVGDDLLDSLVGRPAFLSSMCRVVLR